MSGGFSDTDRERAARVGCALFDKPLEMNVLTAWIEKLADARKHARKNRQQRLDQVLPG
jgi:hypothetical protein